MRGLLKRIILWALSDGAVDTPSAAADLDAQAAALKNP